MSKLLPVAVLSKVNLETGHFGPFVLTVNMTEKSQPEDFLFWAKTEQEHTRDICMALAGVIEQSLPKEQLEGHTLAWLCMAPEILQEAIHHARKLIPEITVLEVKDTASLKVIGIEMPVVPKGGKNFKIFRVPGGGDDHILN